jgi:hypothetical protein
MKFEDLVKALNGAESPFDLANDLPLFKAGMSDLLQRVQALEAHAAAIQPTGASDPIG